MQSSLDDGLRNLVHSGKVLAVGHVAISHLGCPLRANLNYLVLPIIRQSISLPVIEKHVDLFVNLGRVQFAQLAVIVQTRLELLRKQNAVVFELPATQIRLDRVIQIFEFGFFELSCVVILLDDIVRRLE